LISLAPTEDLGIPDDEFHDAESGPVPSHRNAAHDANEDERIEGENSPPSQLHYPRRSGRKVELSQPRLEEDDFEGLDDDKNNIVVDVADLPVTQFLPQALPLCPAPDYGPKNQALKDQKDWKVKPLGLAIPASSAPFGVCPGASRLTFYRSFSMLRDEADPYYIKGSAATVVHSVGDTVLMTWERHDPKEDQSGKDLAVCRLMAIFVDPRDSVMHFIPQWGRSWSDVLNPYSDVDTVEPDDALRKSREIFWEAEIGSWPNVGSKPLVERGLIPEEINDVHNIIRSCIVRHRDEFTTEDEFNDYVALPDSYFYRYSLPHAGPLRFEELPCPSPLIENTDDLARGSNSNSRDNGTKKRLTGPLRVVDVFCGSGAVSCAAIDIGWKVSIGVESYIKSFHTYARNAPEGAKKIMKVQTFLKLVKQGDDPKIPKKGEVEWLHLSPPCQSLSSHNAHKGFDRYTEELIPLLECIRELIMELEPKYITIEEVSRFVFAEMPKVQFTKRKKAEKAAAIVPNEVDNELEVELDNAEETEAEITERLPVRAWLHLVPALLTCNWQVDMRVLNSAHYGCPQERHRLFLFAARRGYELPCPPTPIYHSTLRQVGFKKDDKLATLKDWDSLKVHSDPSLPPAVTVLEAIDDLPRLSKAKKKRKKDAANADSSQQEKEEHPIVYSGEYVPRKPNCISRYVQYIRQGAPEHVFDHEGPNNSCGHHVKPDSPFGTIIGQDDDWSKSRHYAIDRPLTVLERRRGQSFPDKLWLDGSVNDKLKIVGNAVPYLLARAVAASVMVAATGNPSSAPELPNLKGWVDEKGNEVAPPPPSEHIRQGTTPMAVVGGRGSGNSKKRKRINPVTANVNGTAEQEEEEEDQEGLFDEDVDAEKDEEEYEEPENEEERTNGEETRRPAMKEMSPSHKNNNTDTLMNPISPQDIVEFRPGKKYSPPMKVRKINTFFSTHSLGGPTRETTADPEEVELEGEPKEERILQQQQLELEQQRQREQRQLLRQQQRQQREAEEEQEEVQLQAVAVDEEDEQGNNPVEPEDSDNDMSIKEDPAAPAALPPGPADDSEHGFSFSRSDNDVHDNSTDDSSGQSSGGVAVVINNDNEVIDLTMDTDDE
jgi:site-specific DNA-cytosine methylase